MEQFQISAPGRLCLLGERTDLRTRLKFIQTPIRSINNIEIYFPKIKLSFKISINNFTLIFNKCVNNMSHKNVFDFIGSYEPEILYSEEQKIFLNSFFYLLGYMIHKEKIKIKSFTINLSTQLMMDDHFVCPASFVVCLAACLLHWSRLQKGICRAFEITDLTKIYTYAAHCDKIFYKSTLTDVIVSTFGYLMTYQIDKNERLILLLDLPNMTILLIIDSIRVQNEINQERWEELVRKFSNIVNFILDNNNYCPVIINCDCTLKELDIYVNDFLTINKVVINNCPLVQHERLEKMYTIAKEEHPEVMKDVPHVCVWSPVYTNREKKNKTEGSQSSDLNKEIIRNDIERCFTYNRVRIE